MLLKEHQDGELLVSRAGFPVWLSTHTFSAGGKGSLATSFPDAAEGVHEELKLPTVGMEHGDEDSGDHGSHFQA